MEPTATTTSNRASNTGGGGGGGGGASRPPPRGRHENSHALPKGTLPKKLQLFFAPRLPLPYLPPMKKKKPALPYTGVAQYLGYFEDRNQQDAETEEAKEKAKGEDAPEEEKKFCNPEFAAQVRVTVESKMEKILRLRKARMDTNAEKLKNAMDEWNPTKDTKIQGDPFRTLFLSRLNYQTTERDLKKIFGEFGPVRSIRIIKATDTEKSRGYAFIEYEHVSDMKDAYKHADATKIDGRRVLVDVERGRTMEGWRPARLGGGLGAQSRRPKPKRVQPVEKPSKESERELKPRGREDHDRESNRHRDSRRDDNRSRGSRDRLRERDYGTSDRRGRTERGRDEKRYRDNMPIHEDRPGKKKRELEEGEVDHREAKELRCRERDMI